jgi:hypothetical protein
LLLMIHDRLHAADEERIVIANAIEVFRQRHRVLNGQVHAASDRLTTSACVANIVCCFI